MAIAFQCPHCKRGYKVKDELIGKKVACTQCKQVIVVPRPTMKPADVRALEALATAALNDVPTETEPEEAAGPSDAIPMECPFCFEHIKMPLSASGKQAPCPSCRRLIKVGAPKVNKPKDWRQLEHNLTMARKDDTVAPEGAWGNTQLQQKIVSRDALRHAAVVFDRKDLAKPKRGKLYATLAGVAVVGAALTFWIMRDRAVAANRLELVTDALAAAKSTDPAMPAGWPASVYTAAGEFFVHEHKPDLKQAVSNWRLARGAAGQVETPSDRAGLLIQLVTAQAALVGDDAKSDAGKALSWDDAQRELRQTLQQCKDLPREQSWRAIEAATRAVGSQGAKNRPMLIAIAPEALPTDADRAEALACVALILMAKGDPLADAVADEAVQASSNESPSPRVGAMQVARKQMAQAKQLIPEPTGGEPSMASRLAYSEGYARTGNPADLETARKIANAPGPLDHRIMALALMADAVVDTQPSKLDELELAVKFTSEQGARFALPSAAVERLAGACRRAGRADLAKQLADNVNLPASKPWLSLEALRTELGGASSTLEPALGDRVAEKSAAQGLAWVELGRHNAKTGRDDPRASINQWPMETARPMGLAGAALGLQDRGK